MRYWLVSLFLAIPLFACSKKEEPKAEVAPVAEAAACPGRFRELPSPTGEVSCSCTQGTLAGPVWGTSTYTTDSVICTAAVHAGAITQSGGTVRMKALSGCDGYKGSQKNGVTTANWGSYDSSFYFVGHGDGKCVAPPQGSCPADFRSIPNVSEATELECSCAEGQFVGSVWGSSIYTRDSSICQAALHVGAVTKAGGKVKVKASPGCGSYKGSAQNGATSSDWGAFAGSFYFVGHGEGQCEVLAKDACPASYNAIPGVSETTEHTCSCGPSQFNGAVWGNDVYTRDSSICQAALHAGVVTKTGGSVKVKSAPGCPSYKGSVQNGVTTSPWQSFGGSFFFPGKGTGKCQ